MLPKPARRTSKYTPHRNRSNKHTRDHKRIVPAQSLSRYLTRQS